MKKFLSISALLVAVTSIAFVSYGAASQYRPTTNRIYAYNYRNHLRRKVTPTTDAQRFQFWYNYQQQQNVEYDRRAYAEWRSAHDDLFPRDENLHSTEILVVRNDDARKLKLTTALPEEFDNGWKFPVAGINFLQPQGIVRNKDGRYVDRFSDLVFEVDKFEGSCTTLGFQMCAVQRIKHLKELRSLKPIENVKREFSLRRMPVDGEFVYVPMYSEKFDVNDFGIDRVYQIYVIQNPVTEEVFYIEGWASDYNSAKLENILKAVSRTIRFN